uniref:Nuclease-associated modular DNA-binding 1 domain-containing protein n=1 Tax=Mutinus fleischeri TaxID=2218478 RepID=A0A8K1RD67_9AGAM|nr:hypothetical protein [Mutinus fleischeri]
MEYCDNTKTIEREQYYLDNFDFEYNLLEKADSLLGYKHVLETLAKRKGRKNALGDKHTLETLIKWRNDQSDKKHSEESMEKMRDIWAKIKLNSTNSESSKDENLSKNIVSNNKNVNVELNTYKKIGKIIIVTNIDSNLSTEYSSISSAALALNITRNTLRSDIKDTKYINYLP